MKCPKCGYTSFDHNPTCPRCNKEISDAREMINLTSFRPNPPSMLGALTGETADSNIGFQMGGDNGLSEGDQGTSLTPEDSQAIEAVEDAFSDSQDLDIEFETPGSEEGSESLEPAEFSGLETEITQDELSLEEEDDDTVLFEMDEVKTDEPEISLDEDITDTAIDESALELDDLDSALTAMDEDSGTLPKAGVPDDEEAAVDLEDLELDLELDEPDK